MTNKNGPRSHATRSDSDAPAKGHDAASIVASDPVAELLERSDERDLHLRRLLAGESDAYQRGHADGYGEGYDRGYLAAVAEHKAVQRELYRCWRELADLHDRRWGNLGSQPFPRRSGVKGGAV